MTEIHEKSETKMNEKICHIHMFSRVVFRINYVTNFD